ncbi:DUF6035 family protein [Marinobacterium jannaschii]|uniref:DUF6035 family protein n=1 Tax=Marinobacterium jannaschii TaxID=64970 RepID=UPI000484CCD5|nr:DUF6035 family protein [Marinobacterium jannaschii]
MLIQAIEIFNNGIYQQDSAEIFFESHSQKEIQRLRMKITSLREAGEPALLRCSLCKGSLYIKAKSLEKEKTYFLSHYKTNSHESESCPQRSGLGIPIEALRALIYRGALESKKHSELKNLIAKLLRIDLSIPSESIKIESRLKNHNEWRQPDVQAEVGGFITAFEVQVSTEMASMIAARQYFYERFGRILWILPSFDPTTIKQSHIDIAVTNHDHLFVLNEEMENLSREKGEIHLIVWINYPFIENNRIKYSWVSQVSTLSDIKYRNGHAFVVDLEREEENLSKNIIKNTPIVSHIKEPDSDKTSLMSREDYLWNRWNRICDFIIKPDVIPVLAEKLVDEYGAGPQTSKLSGILLRMHMINWHSEFGNDTIVKLLHSAYSGKLYWKTQNWKWASNLLCTEFPNWIGPYQLLLKKSEIWSEVKNLKSIRQAVTQAKSSPYFLSQKERTLLSIIAPNIRNNLSNVISHYSLIDYKSMGFCYGVEFENGPNKHLLRVSCPEFLGYVTSCLREEASAEKLFYDITSSLNRSIHSGIWLSMPNLPILEPISKNTIKIDRSLHNKFIDKLEIQITKLESQITEIKSIL